MSYDLETSVKKLRVMIKIIHFLFMSYYCFQMNSYALRGSLDEKTFEIKNLKLKGEAPVELRYKLLQVD